jgi:hypothetical protein
MSIEKSIKEAEGNAVLPHVSKRYCAGAIWHRHSGKDLIERVIEKEWGKTKVRMTNGQVFSKIFLSKYYRCVG